MTTYSSQFMRSKHPLVGERLLSGRGSSGNVWAALFSLIIPGLGQLCQGRLFAAAFMFVVDVIVWVVGFMTFGLLGFLGIAVHLFAAFDAAVYNPKYDDDY